jgi:hypothetical protein
MCAQLIALMEATETVGKRDLEAMRNSQGLSEILRANTEFQPYWNESQFETLAKQLDDRMTMAAGASGYADLIR